MGQGGRMSPVLWEGSGSGGGGEGVGGRVNREE